MKNKKLVSLLGLICLSLVLLVLPLISGCTAPASAPAPAKAPAPAPAPAAAPAPAPAPAPAAAPAPAPAKTAVTGKVYQLKFASSFPPTSPMSKLCQVWADKMGELSGGRIKVTTYFSGSLVGSKDTYMAVKTGVADFAHYTVGTDPGLTPLSLVVSLPLLGGMSQIDATKITQELFQKFPELEKEYGGMKIAALVSAPPEQFNFTKKQVKVPEDMKGMKICSTGRWWAETLKPAGAVVLNIPAVDLYMSLERGLVEGHIFNFIGARSLRTLELYKHHTFLGDGGAFITFMTFFMNSDTWNNLPPDLQKIVSDTGKQFEQSLLESNKGDMQTGLNEAKAANHTFTYLTPEEIKVWVDLAKPVHETWIKDNAGYGPSKAIYTEIMALIDKYVVKK